MRPSSSTSSMTVSPAKPRCVTTASTRIDVPFSAERGTEIRPIWMSLCSDSSPTPTVKTGTSARLQGEQRVGERRVGRVGAVGHHDETGKRQPGELLAGALERHAQAGLRAGERQLLRIPQAARGGREAEGADDELVREALHHRRLGPELLAGDGAARLARLVGDLHAARVVDQHADEVLLRDGGANHEDRAEEAEEDQRQRGDRAAW